MISIYVNKRRALNRRGFIFLKERQCGNLSQSFNQFVFHKYRCKIDFEKDLKSFLKKMKHDIPGIISKKDSLENSTIQKIIIRNIFPSDNFQTNLILVTKDNYMQNNLSITKVIKIFQQLLGA